MGTAVVSDDGPASLVVAFGDDIPTSDQIANYNVISTDYDNYAIVYSCEDQYKGLFHAEYFWVLARKPELSSDAMVDIIGTITDELPSYDFWNNY